MRKERPHPRRAAFLHRLGGHRITALLIDTAPGVVPGQAAGLELRHRQHAHVEDRIREGKASGLRNMPCRDGRERRLAGGRRSKCDHLAWNVTRECRDPLPNAVLVTIDDAGSRYLGRPIRDYREPVRRLILDEALPRSSGYTAATEPWER